MPSGSLGWEPILSRDLVHSARDLITGIASEIESLDLVDPSGVELCERALLFGYLALSKPAGRWRYRVIESLNIAADRVSRNLPTGVFSGLSSVGWTIEHLTSILAADGVCEPDVNKVEDPLEEIDSLILRRLKRSHWAGPYDLVGGLAGIGVFFLERLPLRTPSRGISLILNHFEQQAEESSCGITWHTPPELLPESERRTCPGGYYNLGVAHGVPGVVQFLGEVVASGIEVARARRLLEGSVQWILAQQHPHLLSRYSNWVVPGEEPRVSRLAWCYGDLGIGAILYYTARRVGRADWLKFAKTLLDLCLTRPLDHVREVGLCHGALGIAHIFNRAYQMDHDDRYKGAANRYYERGLAILKQLEARGPRSYAHWVNRVDPNLSFLEGKIGVALALLSAVDPIEPQWDRRLMLSGCRRSS